MELTSERYTLSLCKLFIFPAVSQGKENVNKRGPNTNQNPPASVLCKSSGKPSTRFPLGRHAELDLSKKNFIIIVRQTEKLKLMFLTFF